jgi:alpha-tubulin suppressor-like RCC1 family protein
MRHGFLWITALGFAAGCSLDVNGNGAIFACEPDGSCPSGLTCVNQLCVSGDGGPGSDPAAGSCATTITAGAGHTCTIRSDGTAWCWGFNDFGQLGDGTKDDHDQPAQVANLTGVKAIDGGTEHTCAIDGTGKLWCWGRDDSGQLGDAGDAASSTPVAVAMPGGPMAATAIATGDRHSCAILGDQSLVCWGNNDSGQLGDGTTSSRNTPVGAAIGKVTAVSAGGGETCAVDGAGALWCWGANDSGQIGNGMAVGNGPGVVSPFPVPLVDVANVAVGSSSACALTGDGAVWCWGGNDHGQVGSPPANIFNHPDITTPVRVPLPIAATAITASFEVVCAIDAASDVWCWGENVDDEIEPSGDNRFTPVKTPYSNVTAIATGATYICVQTKTHGLACSGFNGQGQLGDGRATDHSRPEALDGLSGVATITAGDSFSCALLSADGTVTCWGRNAEGELGDGTQVDRARPGPVFGVKGATAIVAGQSHTCALLGDADQDGVVCWGSNDVGQLGDGTSDTHGVPRRVIDGTGAPITGITQIAAGGGHTCAIQGRAATATLLCWGDNGTAQLGAGGDGIATVAMPAALVPVGILGVAAGAQHTCAITSGRGVVCWGDNAKGQIGRGNTMGDGSDMNRIFMVAMATPVGPQNGAPLAGIDQISSGDLFTCAHATTGSVSCWGDNGGGQIGSDNFAQATAPFTTLRNGAVKVAAGGDHTCAIIGSPAGGTISCWGGSFLGQVGDGSLAQQLVPQSLVQQPPLPSFIDLALGDAHTCALTVDHTVLCWGDDREGELGDGVLAASSPVVPLLTCPAP